MKNFIFITSNLFLLVGLIALVTGSYLHSTPILITAVAITGIGAVSEVVSHYL